MVGLKNWLKSSRILQFLSKLVLQNNLIAHYCFFKQITEMSICHCLSVKKRVSVKNVKILEMSDFGNTGKKSITMNALLLLFLVGGVLSTDLAMGDPIHVSVQFLHDGVRILHVK